MPQEHVAQEVSDVVAGAALHFVGDSLFIDKLVGMGQEDELPPSDAGLAKEESPGGSIESWGYSHEGADIGEDEGGDGYLEET